MAYAVRIMNAAGIKPQVTARSHTCESASAHLQDDLNSVLLTGIRSLYA